MKSRALAALAGLLVPLVAAVAPARAVEPFTGQVVDAATLAPIAGVVVSLTDTNGSDLPGLTATTAPDGTFSIAVDGEEYGVRLDGSPVGYESGFLGCFDVVATWLEACTHAPGPVGTIGLDQRRIDGRVLDSHSGKPVPGVVVHLTDTSGADLPGLSTVTAADGTFALVATGEEHGLRLDGSAVAHEVGYVAYDRTVVPAWGDAVTWAPAPIGDIYIDLTAPGPVTGLTLVSNGARRITATFTAPATGGAVTWYVLTCGSVTRRYTASGQTRGGFAPGFTTCTMVAANRAGVSVAATADVTVRRPGRR